MITQNKITERWVEAFIKRPKAALLINDSGDSKSAYSIVNYINSNLTKSNQHLLVFENDNNTFGIEEVRSLQKSLSLKADNSNTVSRIAYIPNSHKLTLEAQNALLKIVEELPKNTLIILSTSNTSKILKTIKSRCFVINILPLERNIAKVLADKKRISQTDFEKFYSLSEGLPGILAKLIDKEGSIGDDLIEAKAFLKSTVIQRQKYVNDFYKNKKKVKILINTLKIISISAMRNTKNEKAKSSWKNRLENVLETEQYLNSNVPTKLILLRLSVNL